MPFEYVVYAMIGAIFIYVMHRDNILRLFNGTERKIGEKAKAEDFTLHQHTQINIPNNFRKYGSM